MVGVGSSTLAGQDALLSEEEAACADGEEGTFAARILLLQLGKGFDDAQRFGLGLEDGIFAGSTRNNEDVEFGQASQSFLEIDVGAEGSALVGDGVLCLGGKSALEGFGFWT